MFTDETTIHQKPKNGLKNLPDNFDLSSYALVCE